MHGLLSLGQCLTYNVGKLHTHLLLNILTPIVWFCRKKYWSTYLTSIIKEYCCFWKIKLQMNFIQTLEIQFLHMQINSVFIYLNNRFSFSLSIFKKYIKTSLVICIVNGNFGNCSTKKWQLLHTDYAILSKNMLTTFENINRLKSVNSIIIANNKQFHTRKIPQKKQQLQNLLDIRYLENLNDTTNPFNSVTYLLGFHVS